MINFEREELLKIAKLSGFNLDENEIELFRTQLEKVIDYTTELRQVDIKATLDAKANINVFREDKVIPCDSEELLELAPERHDNHFVVPKII